MLPLQPSGELFFQISSNLHQPNYQNIAEDLILSQSPPPAPRDQKKSNNCGKILRGRKKLSASVGEETKVGDNCKKIVHRETEKQRRQEMSTLHATLRSLIPLEHIKGKRSMSDDMNEAVNYIKNLRRKINEKSAARDELKKEIDFDAGSVEEALPLSKVLQVLLDERIYVVNCVSTKVNDRLLHTVHAEVKDPWCLDQQELHRKLNSSTTPR